MRERERERDRERERQREMGRGREHPEQAVDAEPNAGLDLTHREMAT